MAIAFRDAVANSANSLTFTATIPSDVVAGDMLVAVLGWASTTPPTVTNPGGWTQVGSDQVNGTETSRLLWKVAVSGDIGAAVNWASSGQEHYCLQIGAWSGVAQIGTVIVNNDGASGTSHITTTLGSLAASTSWGVAAYVEKSSTNTSWTVPGGLTQRTNRLGSGSGAISGCMADSNAGTSTFTAQTATSGISTKASNWAFELQAAASVVAPGAPTGVSAVAGNASAVVSFTAGTTGGAPNTYFATSTPGSIVSATSAAGVTTPLTVSGLTNGVSYTFKVTATNTAGSTQSSASGSVTPSAPAAGVIGFRGSASNADNTTSYSVVVPAAVIAGDNLFIALSFGNTGNTVTNPAGWSPVGADVVNASMTYRLLSRTAVLGDAGSTVIITPSVKSHWALALLAYFGVSTIGENLSNTDGAAGTSHVTTALAAMAAAGSWAVGIWTERSAGNTSWAIPGALTQRVNQLGSGAGSESILAGDTNAIVTSLAAQTATSGISTTAVNIAIELLAGAAVSAPGAPTGVSAVAGDSSAVVSFTPGSTGGGVVTYTAISNPGGFTGTGAGSPITVGGLTNGTAYTFTVKAVNAGGNATSSASGSVTPGAAQVSFVGIIPAVAGAPSGGGGGGGGGGGSGILLGVAAPNTASQGDATHVVTDYQDGWDQTGGAMPVTLDRVYNSGQPATWASTGAGKLVGPTKWIVSCVPDLAGANDAAISTFAASVPNGQYTTVHHEPEQKTKNILPATFGSVMVHDMALVKAANPTLKFGPVVMTYTSNSRPVDTQGHATFGHNEWLEACHTAGLVPDYVGFDGYPLASGSLGTALAEFTGPAAIAQSLWPGVPMIVAELGWPPGTNRGAQLVESYTDLVNLGFTVISYYDANHGVADYILNPTEASVWAGLA